MNYCEDPARRINNFSFFLGVIDDPGTVHFLCQGKKMNFFEIAIWLHIILLALHCLRLRPFGFPPAFRHSSVPVFCHSSTLERPLACQLDGNFVLLQGISPIT